MSHYSIIFLGIITSLSTFAGGYLALRFKDRLHLILGFSAGAVIGVAFFDLLPESFSLLLDTYSPAFIASIIAIGFIIYLVLDRFAVLKYCPEGHCENEEHNHLRGRIGAGSFSVHSLIDGMAIGFAFQVSPQVGIIVAIAILVHDFSDGINTVNLILKNSGDQKSALKWLLLDSITPLIGVIATLFFRLSATSLGLILALFCGFFFYIGASELLPESHHSHPTRITTVMTLLGVLTLYLAIRMANFQ